MSDLDLNGHCPNCGNCNPDKMQPARMPIEPFELAPGKVITREATHCGECGHVWPVKP